VTRIDECPICAWRYFGCAPAAIISALAFGIATNATDIDRFAAFASEFVDLAEVPDDLPPRTGC
jgi:hypothetical protein